MHVSWSSLALFQEHFFFFSKAQIMLMHQAETEIHRPPAQRVQLLVEQNQSRCWGSWFRLLEKFWPHFSISVSRKCSFFCCCNKVWFLSRDGCGYNVLSIVTCFLPAPAERETAIREAAMCHSMPQSARVEHLCLGLPVRTPGVCCRCILAPGEPQSWSKDSRLSITNSCIPAGWQRAGKQPDPASQPGCRCAVPPNPTSSVFVSDILTYNCHQEWKYE